MSSEDVNGSGGDVRGRGRAMNDTNRHRTNGQRPGGPDGETPEEREARRVLERVSTDTEGLGASSLARSATLFRSGARMRAHFSGADADPDDWAEVWGRRIGRGLGLVAFVVLAIYLFGELTN